MTDFASLGIRIDSSQAKAAVSELDRFVQAGKKAENAANDLANASGKTQKEMASLQKSAASASNSIDRYVQSLQVQSATNGLSSRQTKLFELAVQGASKAQLQAADSALRMNEAYEKGLVIGDRLRTGFVAIAAAAGVVAVGAALAANKIVEQIAAYQGLSEKIGDSAESIASLKTASDLSGVSMDAVGAASVRLTSALSKTDDESKLVGKAIGALGLNFQAFKELSPTEQLDSVAKAMAGFADGSEKTAVAVALFGKSGADLIPFLNDLADGGERQVKITSEQIKAADDFTKSQARLRSEFESFLQLQAVQALPTLAAVQETIAQLAHDETVASVATSLLQAAMSTAINVFQTIAVVASDVGFVFLGVGREIGAIAAQLVALASLDFKGFTAISDAVSEDAARARAELDKFQAKIMSIGTVAAKATSQNSVADFALLDSVKPKLNVAGLNGDKTKKPKKDNSAAQEAKAQLALDLDSIKNAQAAVVDAYDNSEKILEARRAANLVSEHDYYEAKRQFLLIDGRVQEDALQQQIARLQRENLTGKDKLDNDRKIADVQAKLTKLRADSAVGLEVLSIKEEAAGVKVRRAYEEAEAAAQSYFDTLREQQQRELAGLGQGSVARDRNAGRAQIEDRYQQQLQQLASDKRRGAFDNKDDEYQQELDRIKRFQSASLASYDDYFSKRLSSEKDWSIGASEALNNYLDSAANVSKQTEDLFTNAFTGMEDALVSFVTTGKLDFKSLANSVIADLVRIQIKAAVTSSGSGGLLGSLASFFGFGGGGGKLGDYNATGLLDGARAAGGPVSAGGTYLVGEKGPELLRMGPQSGVVIPNGESGGAGANVSITNHIGAGVNRNEVLQAVQIGMRNVKADILETLRQRGL